MKKLRNYPDPNELLVSITPSHHMVYMRFRSVINPEQHLMIRTNLTNFLYDGETR